MDLLDEELIRFWRTLNEQGVRYIMVGGFATRFHGFNRSTDDLDIWLEDSIPFLHINHLIENKKVVNRPKDQIDVIELEKIRKIREEEK
jgi:hypothetical protein